MRQGASHSSCMRSSEHQTSCKLVADPYLDVAVNPYMHWHGLAQIDLVRHADTPNLQVWQAQTKSDHKAVAVKKVLTFVKQTETGDSSHELQMLGPNIAESNGQYPAHAQVRLQLILENQLLDQLKRHLACVRPQTKVNSLTRAFQVRSIFCTLCSIRGS